MEAVRAIYTYYSLQPVSRQLTGGGGLSACALLLLVYCLFVIGSRFLASLLACRIFQTDIGRNASGYLATTGTPIENGFSIQEAASFNLIALVSAHNPGFGFVIFPNCRFLFTQITNPAKTVHQGKGFGNGLASQF